VIVIWGEVARLVRVPVAIDFCIACQVCARVVVGAAAPGPPPVFAP
jgi:hypothetical protein